ncbi:MAG: hypothetical protein PHW62_01520 [Candidatus Ratteibacteria bacterium]|nr:hypothetical protein [Candidatus Ratteibacteria bacterium]
MKYTTLNKAALVPPLEKTDDINALREQKNLEQYDGFCGRCGKPMRIDCRNKYLRHGNRELCTKAPVERKTHILFPKKPNRIRVYGHKKPSQKPRIYLQPWKDPESLFCSEKLKDIIEKEPSPITECHDKIVGLMGERKNGDRT